MPLDARGGFAGSVGVWGQASCLSTYPSPAVNPPASALVVEVFFLGRWGDTVWAGAEAEGLWLHLRLLVGGLPL